MPDTLGNVKILRKVKEGAAKIGSTIGNNQQTVRTLEDQQNDISNLVDLRRINECFWYTNHCTRNGSDFQLGEYLKGYRDM